MERHNTFDLVKEADVFKASSHNFPGCTGSGATEKEAINNMERSIIYLADNEKVTFNRYITDRVKRKVTCLCGYKAPDVILQPGGKLS